MEQLSSNFYLVASIISTLLVVALLVLAIVNRTKKAERVEKRLSGLQNIFAVVSLLVGVISMYITWSSFQSSIKSPDIELLFLTGHGFNFFEDEGYKQLHLFYDNKGNLQEGSCVADSWGIHLLNKGNIGTTNLKVALTFSGVYIAGETTNYTLNNHLRGHGGWLTLERTISDSINPGDIYDLPEIPWHTFASCSNCCDVDITESTAMQIIIYEGSTKKFEQTYMMDMIEDYDELFFYGSDGYSDELKEPMRQSYDNYGFSPNLMNIYALDWHHFDALYTDAYSFKITDLHGPEFVYAQRCYFYYLENLNAYNPNIASASKENVVRWGRLYYRYLSKQTNANYSIQDIEALVANDILSRQK